MSIEPRMPAGDFAQVESPGAGAGVGGAGAGAGVGAGGGVGDGLGPQSSYVHRPWPWIGLHEAPSPHAASATFWSLIMAVGLQRSAQ